MGEECEEKQLIRSQYIQLVFGTDSMFLYFSEDALFRKGTLLNGKRVICTEHQLNLLAPGKLLLFKVRHPPSKIPHY